MKRILIIGEVYSSNLGDGVICETVDYLFSKENETFLLDISGRTKYEVNNVLNIKGFICSKKYEHFKKMIKKVLNLVGGGYRAKGCGQLLINTKSIFRNNFIEYSQMQSYLPAGRCLWGVF